MGAREGPGAAPGRRRRVHPRARGRARRGRSRRSRPGQRTAIFAPAALPLPVDRYEEEATLAAAAMPPPAYAEPMPTEHDERRRPPWWAWLLAALALAAIVLGIVLLTQPSRRDRAGRRGAGRAGGRRRAARGWVAGETVARVTSSRPVDKCSRRIRPAARQADEGSTVTLTVSRGPGPVAVPPVDGLGERKATGAADERRPRRRPRRAPGRRQPCPRSA